MVNFGNLRQRFIACVWSKTFQDLPEMLVVIDYRASRKVWRTRDKGIILQKSLYSVDILSRVLFALLDLDVNAFMLDKQG